MDALYDGESQEMARKLIELKYWQEQFDQAIRRMRYAQTQAETTAQWRLTNEAEKNYLATSDWLNAHGYTVTWNQAEQCYEARRWSK